MESVETSEEKGHANANPNVFDTPKSSISPDESDDHLPRFPTRPCPAAKGASFGNLRVDTSVVNDSDLEKGMLSAPQSARDSSNSPLYGPCREYSVGGRVKECSMWPSRQTLKTRAKQDKTQRRGSTCFGLSKKWGGLTRKQRLWIRVLLVLVVVALGVGVAVGISRAVGGGVYTKGGSKQIPGSS
ncbi:hypothetical protein ANO11243_027030 [Dothideomycetidae sp. 11243]|nr:hypothetical protein ANO11243_027030 [fungal sp. No.11243]